MSQVTHVPLEDRGDVGTEPGLASGLGGPTENLRVSANQHSAKEFGPIFRISNQSRQGIGKDRIYKTFLYSHDLTLRQRPKGEDFHSSCQRFGQTREKQDI